VTLTSEGVSLAVIDNLPRGEPLASPELDNFLTSESYHDRELGRNRMIGGPNRCLLLATGNNVLPSGDTADRSLVVRLYSDHPHPRSRADSEFRTPQILEHVMSERARYLGAALTIWMAWIRAGCPPGGRPGLGVVRWLCRLCCRAGALGALG
jgi:putative DNA primase/helicase